jgi:peptidyl-prolyl cis-trans isomerase C
MSQEEENVVQVYSPPSKWFLTCAFVGFLIFLSGPEPFAAQEDPVLATIGTETITEADVNALTSAFPERFRYIYPTSEGRKKILEHAVNIYVLAAQATKEGLDKDPGFQFIMNFAEKEQLARRYLEKKANDLPEPTEKDAQEYYEQNSAQYEVPASVHLHHILVKTEKEAKGILKQLKKGRKFSELASKESICPSKTKGGDLDWLPQGRLVKELEEVAFSMKKGQIAGPVKTKYGYHVLFLEDAKPARKTSFEEMKDYILEQLRFKRQQEYYEKLTKELRKKMDVRVASPPTSPQATVAEPAGPTAKPRR